MKNFIRLILFLFPVSVYSQNIFGVEPVIKFGSIYRHTVNFKPATSHPSYSAGLNLIWQTTGTREWQRYHHYPRMGVSAGYTEFGNKRVLGHAFYVVPNISLPVASGQRFQFYFSMGTGLAYLTKHYDRISNPDNNVIASPVNNCTNFGLHSRYKVNERFRVFAGGSFTHFSTGDVKLPNLGINIPTVDAGICYTFKPVNEKTFNRDSVSGRDKRIFLGIRTGVGLNEFSVAGGPQYPVYIGSVTAGKFIGRWNKLSVGAYTDYNAVSYYFLTNQEIDKGREKQNAMDVSVLVEDELQFGNFAVTLQVAQYLKQTILSGNSFYQKLGAQYYFLNLGKDRPVRLSWGVYLTTHFFNADYVSSEIGISF